MAGSGGAVSSSVGNSGGILCVWDPNLFIKEHVSFYDYFLAIMGTWTFTSTKLLISSVYAPQDLTEKKKLWGYICTLIDRWEGETVVLGDFNKVWTEHERFGSTFKIHGANAFNNFISTTGLIYLPLGGLCLDRHLSDHRPILMHESYLDYGTTPFHMFHSWFKLEGFDKFVEDTWNSMTISDSNSDNNVDILNQRSSLMKELQDINSIEVSELSQKAMRWSIEGDENSKYFHGILNNKRSKLSIRGIFADGDWITDPNKVKNEFLHHFSKQFSKPQTPNIGIEFQFLTRLTSEQVEDLERTATYDEINKAAWEWFWNLIDQDVVAAVFEFFASGMFPHGCNSSFVALIPKIQDAKVVKDYRPISLIGSMYKIIAKILANRLSFVMPDLISDVQSSFVSDRKILDGPFTLNELLSWCKHKKVNAMIFKVDFKKALDSVRWDYLYESKLMGVGVSMEDVELTTAMVGCSTLSPLFKYLGVNVGATMSRLNSWNEVSDKISSRLSKWKLKTLSIGGRLTLLKSVLTAIPLYHMSLFTL
ncbi:RNA-directed DNA polymerase, eukaryota [Tanacetum coccineum]